MSLNSKTAYNEGVKLTASLINLLAVGVLTAGVTTPLVGMFYGIQIWSDASTTVIVAGSLYLTAVALTIHVVALLVLRSLIE